MVNSSFAREKESGGCFIVGGGLRADKDDDEGKAGGEWLGCGMWNIPRENWSIANTSNSLGVVVDKESRRVVIGLERLIAPNGDASGHLGLSAR